jgi:hypothetical protein
MQILTEILKIVLPSALVIYAMYLVVATFFKKSLVEKQIDLRRGSIETTLPIRLQAYERICLLLERISPNNLIVRLNDSSLRAVEFQQLLLHEIRDEFNHNLSQQIYMSHDAWERVRAAQQEVGTLINQAAAEISADGSAMDLSRKIFEKLMQENRNPTAEALQFVKAEIQQEFM